jgi:hypothetical protein
MFFYQPWMLQFGSLNSGVIRKNGHKKEHHQPEQKWSFCHLQDLDMNGY